MKVNFAESATPDAELIARLRRREIAAWESVYDRYAGHMLKLALRLVGQPPVAEDIVREVFMELWTRADRFQGLAVSVALADSVRKRCLAYLRGRSDSRLRLWQAFDQLPRDQQNVISLAFAGYNWREIAAQLSRPETAIPALARSALQTLSADHERAS